MISGTPAALGQDSFSFPPRESDPHGGPRPLLLADFRGSDFERARQHGKRFGDLVRKTGILDYYLGFCETQLLTRASRLERLAIRSVHSLLARRHSPETRAMVEGFSQGSGIASGLIARALVMPDALNYLSGSHYQRAAALGCTSAAVWGDYTEDGRFLICRNLDFPGNGYWDRAPLIARHRPDKGIPYVSVGTAGTIVDGITGINEEGLTVALHQHMSTEVGLLGGQRPVLDLGQKVLQHCRTLEEAAAACAGWATTSGWTIVVSHWKKRAAIAVERSARRHAVLHYRGGKMVRSNCFHDPALHASEIDYPGFRESSRMRAVRANAIIEEHKGSIGPAVLANLLGDRTDPDRNRIRAFCQVIAQPHNMSSVVFDPERGTAWVSEGAAPACEGPFRKIPLWESGPVGEVLPGVKDTLSGRKFDASRSYLKAFKASAAKETLGAREEARRAVALDPEDPVYRYIYGVLALKCGNPEAALDSFAAAETIPDLPHRRQAQTLWKGRALDLLGRREEALTAYRGLAAAAEILPALKKAATDGLNRGYRADRLPAVVCDFIFGDVYNY